MTLLLLLDDDLLRTILCFLRLDPHGNETVPGLIFENRVWRRLATRFLSLSRDTPSRYDASIAFGHRMLPTMFSGGLCCSKRSVHNRPNRHFYLARNQSTGRVYALLTRLLPDSALLETNGLTTMIDVDIVLSIHGLVQLLSGQNADYKTRLDHFDSMVCGRNVSMKLFDWMAEDQQSVSGQFASPLHCDVRRNVDVFVRWCKYRAIRQPISSSTVIHFSSLNLVIGPGKNTGTLGEGKETRLLDAIDNVDVSRNMFLPPISALLGFYDRPDVAQCGGMQTSLHNHMLPKELMPRIKRNDPEFYFRALGKAAMDRAQSLEADRVALVVYGTPGAAGPSGAPARRPRGAATEAKTGISKAIRVENELLSTGRFKIEMQMDDDDSRLAESNGLVDDQYAGTGEESADDVLYDSDGEYIEGQSPRSKTLMTQERFAEARAEGQAYGNYLGGVV